jgi:hypothetical protein
MFNNYNGLYPYASLGRGLGLNSYPYRPGLLSGIIGGFKTTNWSSLLNNTQRTLSVINQAIPVVNQVKPLWGNAKTMFKIMGAVKSDGKYEPKEEVRKVEKHETSTNYEKPIDDNKPKFFI